MKNLLKISSFVLVCAMFTVVSCQKNKIEEKPESSVVIPFENAPEVKSDFEQRVIATIKEEGHEVRFVEVADKEMVVLEGFIDEKTSLERQNVLKDNDGSTAFDIFVNITDKTTAVPAVIANTADEVILASSKRKIDYTNTTLNIVSGEFKAARACSNMSAGTFRSVYCDAPVSSTPNRIEFCDDGLWISHTRNSVYDGNWRLCDDVYTWTNVHCGIVTLKMSKFRNNAWEQYYQVQLSNGIWYANKLGSSGSDYYRKVTRSKSGGNGFRAYTKFVNQ